MAIAAAAAAAAQRPSPEAECHRVKQIEREIATPSEIKYNQKLNYAQYCSNYIRSIMSSYLFANLYFCWTWFGQSIRCTIERARAAICTAEITTTARVSGIERSDCANWLRIQICMFDVYSNEFASNNSKSMFNFSQLFLKIFFFSRGQLKLWTTLNVCMHSHWSLAI